VPDADCTRDIDAMAAAPDGTSPLPHYCEPLVLVEGLRTDGCSVPLADGTTRAWKDTFYNQCLVHDHCEAMPWTKMPLPMSSGLPDTYYYLKKCNDQLFSAMWPVNQLAANTWATALTAAGQNGGWIPDQNWADNHCTVFNWTALNGRLANDIGVGAAGTVDGSVWIISKEPEPGGYAIYRSIAGTWVKVPGAAMRIAVTSDGRAWIVNNNNDIFEYVGGSSVWKYYPGQKATDIGVGWDGSVWFIGAKPVAGGYGIYHPKKPLTRAWVPSDGWEAVGGGAVAIAVTADGRAWVVNANHDIFEWVNDRDGWKYHPEQKATDIGVGPGFLSGPTALPTGITTTDDLAKDAVWVIGEDPTPGGYEVYRMVGTNGSFMRVGGGATKISAGQWGSPACNDLAPTDPCHQYPLVGIVNSDGVVVLGNP
jgi:hypothetical protein